MGGFYGLKVGLNDGTGVVGTGVGCKEGNKEGLAVGLREGFGVGSFKPYVGWKEGDIVGLAVVTLRILWL